MKTEPHDIEKQALLLSPEAREMLAIQLLNSLESEPLNEIYEAWIQEAKRRYQNCRLSKTRGISGGQESFHSGHPSSDNGFVFLFSRKSREEAMKTNIMEIPDDLMEALRIPPAEKRTRLRRELAVRLYQTELLSFGKARKLAQMSKWEFHILLGQEGIVRHYDTKELEEDLRTLEVTD